MAGPRRFGLHFAGNAGLRLGIFWILAHVYVRKAKGGCTIQPKNRRMARLTDRPVVEIEIPEIGRSVRRSLSQEELAVERA
jgi:hypothetical protein